MSDQPPSDTTHDPVPEERPAAPARKRTRKVAARPVESDAASADVMAEPSVPAPEVQPQASRAVTQATEPIVTEMTSDATAAATASTGGATEGAPGSDDPSGDRERPKRPRRRGRRGKEGREAQPGSANQGTPPPRGPVEGPAPGRDAPARREELEPQTKERLGETFAHVTSEGYDEEATPTDEELRALEESAQARIPDDVAADAAAGAGSQADAPDVAADALAESASGESEQDERSASKPGAAAEDARVAGRPSIDRRQLAPQRDAPKLQKVLAQSGAGSRRDIEQWIVEGRVTVNGEKAHTGQRVSFGDRVAVDGKAVRIRIAPLPARVIAYHKPVGEIVTHDDPQQRPTVFRKLPRLAQGKWQSVGRLDINTEGLLLFTNSGELANQLMHPRFGIEREYAVRVLGSLDDASRARLLEGVDVDGQPAAFLAIDEGAGDGANRWYRVTITEGRHREVRKLFDAVGLAVSRLIRIRYGAVVLPRGLKRGVWVDLPEGDVKALRRMVGHGERDDRGGDEPRGPKQQRRGRGGRNQQGPGQGHGQGRGPGQGQGQGQHGQARQPQDPRANHDNRGPAEQRPPKSRGGDRHQGNRGGQRRNNNAQQGGGGENAIPNPLMQTYDRRAGQDAKRTQREYGDDGPIPNPLQQNFDKRALREANRVPRRDYGDEGPIPNPLQQTFDKRHIQGHGDALVLGRRQQRRGGPGGGQGGGREPDPMQTAVGYIGADAFHAKSGQGRGNKGGGGGRRRR